MVKFVVPDMGTTCEGLSRVSVWPSTTMRLSGARVCPSRRSSEPISVNGGVSSATAMAPILATVVMHASGKWTVDVMPLTTMAPPTGASEKVVPETVIAEAAWRTCDPISELRSGLAVTMLPPTVIDATATTAARSIGVVASLTTKAEPSRANDSVEPAAMISEPGGDFPLHRDAYARSIPMIGTDRIRTDVAASTCYMK